MSDSRTDELLAAVVATYTRHSEAARAHHAALRELRQAEKEVEKRRTEAATAQEQLLAHLSSSTPYVYDFNSDEYVPRDSH